LSHIRGEPLSLVTRHTIFEQRETKKEKGTFHAQVLLAEDNFVNQQVTTEILKSFGCEVTVAVDGHEAIEWTKRKRFDLIFMDGEMHPGRWLYCYTRNNAHAEPPGNTLSYHCSYCTCLAGRRRERCLARGMDDYISKPVESEKSF
jgi:CheY-like chemotaxis protein